MSIGSAYLRGARIVVIGAGAIGSVLTYRLAQAGAQVTLVERAFPGSGTTGNSFAWVNSFGKTPREYHRLNASGLRAHQELARELDGEWLHAHGGLQWAYAADQDHVQHLRDTVKRLREWGYRVETLTPEQATRDLEPDLFIDPDTVEEVFYTPNEAWINGVGLCHGATSAAVRRYGATLVHDEVTGFGLAGGAIEHVRLAGGGSLPVDAVINAAGPNAARVAALAGVELPVTRQPGCLIVTEPAPVALRAVIHAPEGIVRGDGGWRLLLHGEDFDHWVESETPITIDHPFCQQAVERARAVLPGLAGIRAEGVRFGVRPMPRDGRSIVGFDPGVTGLYHVATHSGVTLCATLGQLVTEDLNGEQPPELEPFRPTRFTDRAALVYTGTQE